LKVLVESGQLNEDSLGTILLRKTDWHDYDGIKWLLERGVDPNRKTRWGKTAIHNAVLSDNDIPIIQALIDHGADPQSNCRTPGAVAGGIFREIGGGDGRAKGTP
jgi:ankyrin repeat protein